MVLHKCSKYRKLITFKIFVFKICLCVWVFCLDVCLYIHVYVYGCFAWMYVCTYMHAICMHGAGSTETRRGHWRSGTGAQRLTLDCPAISPQLHSSFHPVTQRHVVCAWTRNIPLGWKPILKSSFEVFSLGACLPCLSVITNCTSLSELSTNWFLHRQGDWGCSVVQAVPSSVAPWVWTRLVNVFTLLFPLLPSFSPSPLPPPSPSSLPLPLPSSVSFCPRIEPRALRVLSKRCTLKGITAVKNTLYRPWCLQTLLFLTPVHTGKYLHFVILKVLSLLSEPIGN